MNRNIWSQMPRDPFENDPHDPSNLLEPDEPFEPLTPQEIKEVRQDLAAVREFREELAAEGLSGICMMCPDCEEMHYYSWDALESHYHMLLAGHPTPVHEPEFNPDPNKYAPWEYCAGFIDGRRSRRFNY